MTVKIAAKRHDRFDWLGVAADVKPTTGAYGSTFYVTDTGLMYVYSAAGWTVHSTPVILQGGSAAIGALAAGETHIGEVGTNTFNIVSTPVIGAAAFQANDIVGAKLTLANAARVAAGSGIWQSLVITDAAKQAAALEIFLFNADLTVAADNAAEATSAADMLKCVGHVVLAASDWKTLANASVASIKAGFTYKLPAGTTMYAFIRCTGTPTFTANCLQLTFGLLRD